MLLTKQLLAPIDFQSIKTSIKEVNEWVNDDGSFIFGWTIPLGFLYVFCISGIRLLTFKWSLFPVYTSGSIQPQ